jgi:rhomboid family protein
VLNLIPISDANPTRRFPIVTIALIILNVLAFFFVEPDFGGIGAQNYFLTHVALPCQLDLDVSCPSRVQTGSGIVTIPERDIVSFVGALLLSTFLHGGWLHIIGNMLFLWIFGNNVEDFLGPVKYLVFYLVGGIVAGLSQILTNLAPIQEAITPAVGASGAVAAVLGAYIVLYPRARVNAIVPIFFFFTVVQLSAWVMLGLWFLMQVFSQAVSSGQGIAFLAHIGGFVFGVVAIFLLGGRPEPRPLRVPYGGRPF